MRENYCEPILEGMKYGVWAFHDNRGFVTYRIVCEGYPVDNPFASFRDIEPATFYFNKLERDGNYCFDDQSSTLRIIVNQ